MKKIICRIIFLISLTIFSQEKPKSLDLEEAIQFALENNSEIINAKLEIDKAYKEKWKTISEGLDNLSVS